jgi:DNA (cytosine-5)-methyltransferase 1
MTFNVLDLFSGIGGFSLGLERAGMRTVAFCEIDPFCRRVLAKHWPGVPVYSDVSKLTAEQLRSDGIDVDVICGGFPCQDISDAGLRAGITGERSGLWGAYSRLIGELRPRYVIVENVAALLGRGLDRVLGDLAAIRYDAEWHCIPAGNLGAPHERDRLWIVAYPNEARHEGLRITGRISAQIPVDGIETAYSNAEKITRRVQFSDLRAKLERGPGGLTWKGGQWPESEPVICRMDDGIPDRVGRTGAAGNAVVPQIPEIIGRAILEAEGLTA